MLPQRRLYESTVPFTHWEALRPWYLSLPSFEGRVWQVRGAQKNGLKGENGCCTETSYQREKSGMQTDKHTAQNEKGDCAKWQGGNSIEQ